MFKQIFAGIALASAAAFASAQAPWPSETVKIIVAHPPGGFTDMLARLVADKMSGDGGQTVIVENKGGGGSTIGEHYVAQSKADGYTLLLTTRDTTIRHLLYKSLPYNPTRDFKPVSLLAFSPMALVANPSFPANTLDELIAMAKKSPGMITVASGGNGTGAHLAMEMFQREAGIELLHVPYSGVGPATRDLLGDHVSLMFAQIVTSLPQIRAGKLKVIAMPGSKRSAVLPNVPTMDELGMKGFNVTPWFGVMVPTATPKDVTEKIAAELKKVMNRKDVREELEKRGVDPEGNTPEEFAALIQRQQPKWDKIVKEVDLQVQ